MKTPSLTDPNNSKPTSASPINGEDSCYDSDSASSSASLYPNSSISSQECSNSPSEPSNTQAANPPTTSNPHQVSSLLPPRAKTPTPRLRSTKAVHIGNPTIPSAFPYDTFTANTQPLPRGPSAPTNPPGLPAPHAALNIIGAHGDSAAIGRPVAVFARETPDAVERHWIGRHLNKLSLNGKKVVFGCVCGVLAAGLLLGLVLGVQFGDKEDGEGKKD